MTVANSPPDHSQSALTMVQLVLDRDDSLHARRLAARAARAGIAVCRATPEAGPTQLARDVLRSLGKRFDVADSPRRAEALWPRVTTWLLADNVPQLIVLRAHLLPADSIAQLLAAMRRRIELTLFVHAATVPPALHQALVDADVIIEQVDLGRHAPATQTSPKPSDRPVQTRLPVLPRDDFLFFLQACAETLDGDAFNRVCDVIAAARRATDQWLESHVAARGPAPQRPSKHRVLAFLEALTQCDDSEEALVRLRGAQIALLFDALLVDVDSHAFVAAHTAAADAIARLDANAIMLLGTYSSPVYAAAGVIALAARSGARSLAALSVGDVASDGREVRVAGHAVIVPDNARALVRAQHITRLAQGAQPRDAFFTSPRAPDRPASISALRTMLGRIGQQTGLAMPSSDASPRSWWNEPARAICVHPL